jgi:dienelactone hydrolase
MPRADFATMIQARRSADSNVTPPTASTEFSHSQDPLQPSPPVNGCDNMSDHFAESVMHTCSRFLAFHVAFLLCVLFEWNGMDSARAQVFRTEVHPIATQTLTDQQFLTGAKDGKPTTVAGVLRVPTSSAERLPAVVLVHGSAGAAGNIDYWSQKLNDFGIATFAIDYFSGRGIVETRDDQAQLGNVAPILDAYNALTLLAANPRIDPDRIAIMGFSRGARVAMYASLTRFQRMYAPTGPRFAAYVAFYMQCNTRYIGDEEVSDKPIRFFHGASDDWNSSAACRAYADRLRRAGRDVQLTEYTGAYHMFDNPLLGQAPELLPTAIVSSRCTRIEETPGVVINLETKERFSFSDACVTRGPHVAYNRVALEASTQAVKEFFGTALRLK